MKRIISCSLVVAMLIPWSATAQAPAVLPSIGAAGAVAGRVEGLLQGAAAGKIVESGQPLFENEKISTNEQGRLQVLLKDETVFTIGPNSSMALDKFVYNPDDSGTISIAVKGFFRFITGRIARRKPSEMEVKMPVGVIGIRGTIVAGVTHDDGSSTIVLLGPGAGNNAGDRIGQATVSNNGRRVFLLQPGSAVSINKDGTLGPVFRISPDQLNGILGPLGNKQANDKGLGSKAGILGGSGSDQSGQTTGKGLGFANDTDNDIAAFTADSQLLNTINGTQIVDGPASWDQVRTLQTGQATYIGTGSFTQATITGGSPCVGNCVGTSQIVLDINFGARTFGSANSFVSFSAVNGDSTGINTTSYAALSGAAIIPQSSLTNSAFTGTTISLNNQGGTIAKTATAVIQYSQAGITGSGIVTGSR